MHNDWMLRRTFLLAISLLVSMQSALPLLGQAEQPGKPIRVLFVGNSYTFFNNLPYLLETIAGSQKEGRSIETDFSLSGGKTLQWHWEQENALTKIREGGWDFVVLQEFSTLGYRIPPGGVPKINHPAAYFEYATRFHEEIAKVGARTVLYATWARDGYPEQQRRLDDAFIRFAGKVDAGIVPAGLAWTVTKLEAPGIRLHMPDRSHPTMAGSYLNALLFYHCLTGKGASNPPATIRGPKWNDAEEATLIDLPWSDAMTLNQIANRVAEQEPRCPAP